MSTTQDFANILSTHGSDVTIHRDNVNYIPCPCLTPEGFRDPEWHLAHPLEPVCNEQGLIPDPASPPVDLEVKAFVQPAQSTRLTRLANEWLQQVFGEIQSDDHVGIFPCAWGGKSINFLDFSQTGAEYIVYNSRRFMVVNSNLIPDPSDGNPFHHWEVALRLIS